MKHSHIGNLEWGKRARKDEDRLRGLNAKDARTAIVEQIKDMIVEDEAAVAELVAIEADLWGDPVEDALMYDAYLDSIYQDQYDDFWDSPYDDGPDYNDSGWC